MKRKAVILFLVGCMTFTVVPFDVYQVKEVLSKKKVKAKKQQDGKQKLLYQNQE